MLFRKKIARACIYCANGTQLDEDTILCTKRGVVKATGKCRRFLYDPCKRIPPRPKAVDFSKYADEDYSL